MRYSFIQLIVYSLVLLLNFYSCGPIATVIHEECTTVVPYQFNIHVKAKPAIGTYQLGDTIFINFEFNAKMKDQADGKLYDLKDFKDFYPAIRLYRLDESIKNPYFFDFSDTCCLNVENLFVDHYLPERETRKDAGLGFDFIYDQSKDSFHAKVAFIMKKKGIYYFKISSESKADLTGPFPGKCNTRLVYFGFNQQTDGNFDLVKSIYTSICKADASCYEEFKREFNKEGGYAFEVK